MPTHSAWRQHSADDRREARRRQLVDAALGLIADEGIAAAGVRAVCRRAGLTSRYFYESFTDIGELHAAVMDEVIAAVLVQVRAAFANGSGRDRETARAAMAAVLDALTADERRARLLLVEAAGHATLLPRRRALLRELASVARDNLVALGGGPEDRLTLAAADLFAAGFFDLILGWYEGHLPHTRDQLIDDAVDLLNGFTVAVVGLVQARDARR